MSGGKLDIIRDFAVETNLIGFRSEDLNLNFYPYNSIVTKIIEPCEGKLFIEANSLRYRLTIEVNVNPNTFTGLYGPSIDGFIPMC
jgi:hypothetical protein